jgi:hypothetical protein
MLRYLLLTSIILMSFAVRPSLAIDAVDAVITTAVFGREPVDMVEVFPRQNGQLYCFTRITGAEEPVKVYHDWYRGEQLMSRVELPVNSSSWRTWSAKQLLEDWPGEWHVEVLDESGNLLKRVDFQLL